MSLYTISETSDDKIKQPTALLIVNNFGRKSKLIITEIMPKKVLDTYLYQNNNIKDVILFKNK